MDQGRIEAASARTARWSPMTREFERNWLTSSGCISTRPATPRCSALNEKPHVHALTVSTRCCPCPQGGPNAMGFAVTPIWFSNRWITWKLCIFRSHSCFDLHLQRMRGLAAGAERLLLQPGNLSLARHLAGFQPTFSGCQISDRADHDLVAANRWSGSFR